MPLSEQEQRLLDEMERNLYQSGQDPVVRVGSQGVRLDVRAIVIGVLGVILGLVTLLVGVSNRLPWLGVIGFVVMFAGVLFAVAGPKGRRSR